MPNYDVFISYRRDGGELLAHILYERLKEAGYKVFQDVESLRSGNFNTALYEVIDNCQDFILLLTPGSLERCANPNDWVRQEIVRAMQMNKNIVPVLCNGFDWPETLPADMEGLQFRNGPIASVKYMDQFFVELQEFLDSAKIKSSVKKRRHSIRTLLFAGVYILGLLSPLLIVFVIKQPFVLWQRILYALWLIGGAMWFLNEIETRPEVAASCFGTLSEEDLCQPPQVVYSRISSVFGKGLLVPGEIPPGFTSYYHLKRLEFGTWDNRQTNYLKIQFMRKAEWYDPSVFYLHALSKGGQAVKMLTRQGFVLQLTPQDLNPDVDYLFKGSFHVFLSYRKRRLAQAEIYNCSDAELRERLGR